MTHDAKWRDGSPPAKGKKPLQRLRREAGYKTARDFARILGIPASTYSRYEQLADGPESRIPMKAAWVMADALGCSIDLIVGRSDSDERESTLQYQYNHLSESSQERFDEYMQFLQFRDRVRELKEVAMP